MNPIREVKAEAEKTRKKIERMLNAEQKKMKNSIDAYTSSLRKQIEQKEKDVKAGKTSETEYKAWLKEQFSGKKWDNALNGMTDGVYESNKQILDEINGKIIENIVAGANNEAFQAEKDLGYEIGMIPIDEETIAEWLENDPDIFPIHELNEDKDKDWNGRRITNSILTCIIIGLAVNKWGDYSSKEVTKSNRSYWMEYLFTTNDSARGFGKDFEGCQEEENGIEVVKQWSATLDFKTRDAHRELDGQIVPLDQPFVYDDDEIWFPRDPKAKAYLRCNCRCASRNIRREDRNKGKRKENIWHYHDGTKEKPILDYMTYDDWFKMKQEQAGGAEALEEIIKEQKRAQQRAYYKRRKRRLKNDD